MKEIEPYDPYLPAREQVARAIREAEALSRRPADGGTSLHVHHHYAPAAAPAAAAVPVEKGPLAKYSEWLILLTGVLILVGGVVAMLIVVFGMIVAGLEALAGSLMMLGIVAAVIVAAAKAPAGKGRK